MIQDNRGFIWLGTSGGLVRYDGREFTTFTTADGLSFGTVISLAEDGRGSLWIGTGLGLTVRRDGRFHAVDPGGLRSRTIRAIIIDGEGCPWVGTDEGVAV